MWQLIHFKYAEEFVSFWLTEFFHSWPHIAYQGFTKYSSTFDPDDPKYVQTLIFWGAVPVVWLVASLLFVIIYGICQCCKNRKRRAHPQPNTRNRTKCLKWMIITLALLSAAFVGFSFYGNETTASGVQHFIQTVQHFNDTVESAEQRVDTIHSGITVDLAGEVSQLQQLFDQPTSNATRQEMLQEATRQLQGMLNIAAANITKIDAVFNSNLDLSFFVTDVQYYETFRWLGLIGIFCFELIICLMVLCGACTRSKCSLVSASILCVTGVILVWCLAGAEMFITMGLSDLCHDPDPFVIKHAQLKTDFSDDVINYYIKCDQTTTNPFGDDISSANKYLTLADAKLDRIAALAKGYYADAAAEVATAKSSLSTVSSSLLLLSAHVDCSLGVHEEYTTALYTVCYDSVLGVAVMLLSAAITGILFTLIIMCAINLNGRLPKRKMDYAVDQEDPFLPPADNTATLERYQRNVEPQRRPDPPRRQEPPAPLPSDPRARPISLSSSLQGYSHEPGPSSSAQWAAAPPQRAGNRSWGVAAGAAAAPAPATTSSNQMTVNEGYDSPPPSYTLAMSRDNQRRNQDNQRRNQGNRQNQARLSSGSLV